MQIGTFDISWRKNPHSVISFLDSVGNRVLCQEISNDKIVGKGSNPISAARSTLYYFLTACNQISALLASY